MLIHCLHEHRPAVKRTGEYTLIPADVTYILG